TATRRGARRADDVDVGDRASAWWRHPLAAYGGAAAAYLALSVGLWWHVWTGHPTTTATCGCGDPAIFMWFLEWPAYAVTHGLSPFHSGAVFPPVGMDLLANTSVLGIGIPLVPVTLLLGPVATLNVAATATPVVTGLATFWLLRRWVRWAPAAFAGGLLYAFSPVVLSSLEFAHLMTAALAPLPLIVGCLDELLLGHRRRPVPVGIALATLVAVEFFVSTEIVSMLGIVVSVGLAVLVGAGAVADRRAVVAHVGRAGPGLAAAGVLTVALLAYPAWYALAGPGHLSGPVWADIPVLGGIRPSTFVVAFPAGGGPGPVELGGYLGPTLPASSYVGWGLLALAAVTLVVWRRDRRLWFLAVMALVSGSLMLGVRRGSWVPWDLFSRLPVVRNVIEQRFVVFALLALCAMWAIGLDRASRLRWRPAAGTDRPARRVLAAPVVAVAVGLAVAVAPIAVPLAGTVPFAVQPVTVPAWFGGAGRHLPSGRVVLAYPAPFSGLESPMAWQGIEGMDFTQAQGSGPQGVPWRTGRARAGTV
ncbi:MAG: hypothetical protein ACRDWN_10320, partial [Acidimicrobiales bacterium]